MDAPDVPDTGLPIEASITAVRAALAGPAGAAVLTAEPGAGKTTVVPLRLLGEDWLGGLRIVMLEPRRLATRAAARRMADTLGEAVGQTVGYVTRDERRTSAATRVEVVTQGILTRRLQRDRTLAGVGIVIFDELHERNLDADLGLALAIDARRATRPDLRLLAMSATIDAERVARLIGPGTPVVASEGRQHPVEIRWRPAPARARVEAAASDTIRRALREEPGDLLAFLPGAGEIRRAADQLGAAGIPGGVEVRPLHGSLSLDEQDLALTPSPPGRRKVVLATDIAETSLTVEGVRVVVDAGLARVPRFDARTGLTRLTTVAASKASVDQRAGRAGRTQPGVAYRMWSKIEHATRRPYGEPEITQVDLAGFALELALWGVENPADLALLDQPPARTLAEGRELLRELGALAPDGTVTAEGAALAELPLHPRLARMVHTSRGREPDGWHACLLAALLEDRDILRGPPAELPVDVAVRLSLLADPGRRHPRLDGRSARRARERAHDVARRTGITPGPVEPGGAGRVLALAYPDRLGAQPPGGRGRFTLRSGSAAVVPPADPLSTERYLVIAELDARGRDARIRLAAPIDAADLDAIAGGDAEEVTTLVWDRNRGPRGDLVARIERRVGRIVVRTTERAPEPGEATARALLAHVRSAGVRVLGWNDEARALQARIGFLRRHAGGAWPEVDDRALLRTLDEWLLPRLAGATGRADLEAVDLVEVLTSMLPAGAAGDLERLAPATVTVPSGRALPVDYRSDPPSLAVRVQEMFGTTETPTVAGGNVALALHLLSPAGRPLQVTSDLAGFWQGSWAAVCKDHAGRYPAHAWPADPARAAPQRR